MLQNQQPLANTKRRRFQRQRVWLRCWVQDDVVRRYACVSELSAGGARIVTTAPPAIGSTVEVVLVGVGNLQREEHVRLHGSVIWRSPGPAGRGGLMGIQFAHGTAGLQVMKYLQQD